MKKVYIHEVFGWEGLDHEGTNRYCIGDGHMTGTWFSEEEIISLGFKLKEKDIIDEEWFHAEKHGYDDEFWIREREFRRIMEKYIKVKYQPTIENSSLASEQVKHSFSAINDGIYKNWLVGKYCTFSNTGETYKIIGSNEVGVPIIQSRVDKECIALANEHLDLLS